MYFTPECSESQAHRAAALQCACSQGRCLQLLFRCPVQVGVGPSLPSPGSAGGGRPSSTPTPAVLLGILSRQECQTRLLLLPNHCPSTLHKNPHQFWQPSNYSRTFLSLMKKEMLHYEGDYVKSISNITICAIDSLQNVSLWCTQVS